MIQFEELFNTEIIKSKLNDGYFDKYNYKKVTRQEWENFDFNLCYIIIKCFFHELNPVVTNFIINKNCQKQNMSLTDKDNK